jgi:hypothetical protein
MRFGFLQVLFWLAAGCCLVAHAAIVRSVFRGRRDAGWVADATWAAVPAVGLLLILIWTWHVLHQVRPA